jgi:hypothetical protein
MKMVHIHISCYKYIHSGLDPLLICYQHVVFLHSEGSEMVCFQHYGKELSIFSVLLGVH